MQVGNDHVKMQTGGRFEVQTQKIGDMMSAKMSTYKVGSARAMGRQQPREPVRASSVPRRFLKRT